MQDLFPLPAHSTSRRGALLGSTLLGSLLLGEVRADLYRGVPPGGNFALENWNITIPADNDGGTGGDAVTVRPDLLSGPQGYQSRWFHTDKEDGAMTFWAPINGATVGGSSSPRSELREMQDPSNGSATWNGAGSSALDVLVKVTQVPGDGIVIVGQVHGYGSPPLIMIYYRYDHAAGTGRVIAKLQETPVQGPPYSNHTLASNVDLGETFSYQLKVQNNRAMASVNGHTPVSMAMSPAWDGETFYFKAGAYLHMHGSSATEGGRVKFYRLAASHPNDGLRIDSPAALPAARAGRTYRARSSSIGGVGGATWRLVSGHPPAGLHLEPDGLVTGTPESRAASERAHWFMVQVSDVNGSTHAKTFSVLVRPATQ